MSTTITISTTPAIEQIPATSMAQHGMFRSRSLVGVAARVVAGVLGALLGVAIGLVSAGFDTTRLLLAVGAVALGLGWVIALATSSSGSSGSER